MMMFDNGDDDDLYKFPLLPAQAADANSAAPQAPEPTPMDPPDSMNPMVKDYITKKFNLGDYNPTARQQLVQDSQPGLGDHALAALAAIGAGFQGKDAAAAGMNRLKMSQEEGQQKIKNFDDARKNAVEVEAQDPNSDSSKRFRATLKANFPDIAAKYGDAFDSLTSADQKSVFQVAETKAKLEGAQANRDSVMEFRKANAAARSDAAKEKMKQQLTAQDDKDAKALQKHLGAGWTARSGQAGVVQGNINAAERAEKLIEQAKSQPGGLDSRQIEELSQATAKLLGGGGASASARVEALVPHTFWGNAQTMKEFLLNNPTGQGMEKFTDRLADTISREKALAEQQKRQYQIEGLGAHSRLKKSNPDLYNELLQNNGVDPSMIDEKGRFKAPSETKQINGKTYKKVPGGWAVVEDMKLGEN